MRQTANGRKVKGHGRRARRRLPCAQSGSCSIPYRPNVTHTNTTDLHRAC